MPLWGFPVGAPPTTKALVDETCDGTLHLMTNFSAEQSPAWQFSRKCNKKCPVYKASLHDFKGEHRIVYKPLFFKPLHNPDGNRQPEVVDLTGDTEDQQITSNRFVLVVDLTGDTEEQKKLTNPGYVRSDGYVTGDKCVEHNVTVKKESFLRIAEPLDNDEPDEAKCSVEAEGTAEVRGAARSGHCAANDEEDEASTATESDAEERETGASASGDRPEDRGAAIDDLQPEANRLPKFIDNSFSKSFVHVTTQTTASNQPTIATNSPNTGLSQSNTSSSQQPSKVKRYPPPSTRRRPLRVVDRILENLLAGRYRHRFLHCRQLRRHRNNAVGSDNSSTTYSLCGRTNVIRTGPGVTNGASHGSNSNTINTQGGSNNAGSTSTNISSVRQNGTGPGVTNGASHAPNSNTTNAQGDSSNSSSPTASSSSVSQNCPSYPRRENSIPCGRLSHPTAIIKSGNTMKAVYSIEDSCCPIIPMQMTGPTLKTFTKAILIADDTNPSVTVTVGNTDVITTLTTNGSRPTVTTNDGNLRTAMIRNDSSPNTTVTRNGGGQVASITRNDSGPTFTISQDNSGRTSTITRNNSGPTPTITSCDSEPSATLTRNGNGLSAAITRSDSGPSVITNKDNSNPSVITKNESAPSTNITRKISGSSATIIKDSNVKNGTITGNGNDQSTTIPITYFTGNVGGSNATTATNRCGQTGEHNIISEQQRATSTENGSDQRAIVTGNGSSSSTTSTSTSVTNANTPKISNKSSDNSEGHNVVLTNSSCGKGSSSSSAINSAMERNCSTSINSRSELLISSTASLNGSLPSMPTSDSGQSSSNCISASVTCGGVDIDDYNADYVDNDADTVVDDDAVTLDDPDEEGDCDDDDDVDEEDDGDDDDDDESGGVLDSDDDEDDDGGDDGSDHDIDGGGTNNNGDDKGESNVCRNNNTLNKGITHSIQSILDYKSNDVPGQTGSFNESNDSSEDEDKSNYMPERTGSFNESNDTSEDEDKSNDMPDQTDSFNESNDTSEDEDNTSTNISGCNKGTSDELSAPPAIPRDSYNDNNVSSHSKRRNKRNNTSIKDNVAKRMKLDSAANDDFQRMQDERTLEYKYIDYIDLTKE